MCKHCGKKGAKMKSAKLMAKLTQSQKLASGELEGVVFRYKGNKARTEFVGASTGLRYVTGAGERHNTFKVHPDDAEFFVEKTTVLEVVKELFVKEEVIAPVEVETIKDEKEKEPEVVIEVVKDFTKEKEDNKEKTTSTTKKK